jgi:soluble lytic murein transglycosylase
MGLLFLVNSAWFLKKTAYPMPYQDQVFYYSNLNNIDPYLVTAVIRVESKFKPQANSVRGARGLMQIMPETGQWAAQQMALTNFEVSQLYDAERNIQIGCWYLGQLSQEFDGRYPLMLAAFNAGQGRVNNWLLTGQWDGHWETLDNIPFVETREYLEKVNADYQMYVRLYSETAHPKAFKPLK